MSVAVQANDLQLLSRGRFTLGLGTHVKQHINRRFSMPYSHPCERMREFVLALRAIWKAFAGDGPHDFRGEFYTHTLMTPFLNPGPNPYGNPKIVLAAVGSRMAEVAGEVADGIICHTFTTERYLREVTLPALRRGAARAGRDLKGFEIVLPAFVVARDTPEELASACDLVRQQIGAYGSTPAYRAVLEIHGWGELQDRLNALVRSGEWPKLPTLIDDELLHTFAITGRPEEAAVEARRRFGDVVTRIGFTVPDDAAPARWAPVLDSMRAPLAPPEPASRRTPT